MTRRGMVAVITIVLSATVLLTVPAVSGAPVGDGSRLINKEVPYPPEGSSSENDIDVQELHSLNFNIESTATTTTSFPEDVHQKATELKATESKGTESKAVELTEEEKRSSENKSEFVLSDFTSSSDTPRDMAEYIFWTGDEGSVTSAIKDFIDQGLMTADDGREFMEEVRYDLHQIQLRYGTVTDKTDVTADRTKYIPKTEENDDESRQLSELMDVDKIVALEGERPAHEGEIVVTSYDPKNMPHKQPEQGQDRLEEEIKSRDVMTNVKEEHFDEAHIVDLLSNEYSLEEIIYQLARILFSQSLSQAGHPEAEEALKKFADFLEKESKEGKMSPQVQRKVLDVLLMSLFDAMGDQGRQQHISPPTPVKNLADKH